MPHAKSRFMQILNGCTSRAAIFASLLLAGTTAANAGGPRWVAGPPYFTNWQAVISWYTNHPLYFTDAGDLSPTVSHAAADAIVAQAAAVWNVPTASLVLAQGGSLNEHVSGANMYAGPNGPVFPADVQSTNYAAKQIAIIYDTDGSVTDALLGSGASDPLGCLQTGVTESVDAITPQGQIQHAILILNGRCTGPQPEKQLQMQYQLVRAFGRILGLSWSQTNDNVFTGSPTPTHEQALNWPIMHPMDIVCGPYTYQCLPEPFTLRADDISSLEQLYFIQQGQAPPGKIASWDNAGGAYGWVNFPNGQGMEGVNVVVRRRPAFFDTAEDWQTASSVSGYGFRGRSGTSMTPQGPSAAASIGSPFTDWEGRWRIQSIPVPPSADFEDLIITTEPINPLYTGPYAIGPQAGNTISPSGSPQMQVSQYLGSKRDNLANFTPGDAAATCQSGSDGTEGAPAAVPSSGWWNGTLCAYGHEAWDFISVKANRTLTLEITALDEQGLVTVTKAMPTLGAWKSTDGTGTLPTVASAAVPFNSISVGMTTLQLQSSTATSFRIAIADQRAAGRPDFAYQGRALYADAVTPANIGSDGGTVTITGIGFRQGNAVLINGVQASVASWTQTAIVATVPSLHTLGLSRATVASITVKDVSTGGTSTMTGALTYAAPVEALHLLSAPTGTVSTGTVAPSSFSVKAIAPDGFTPIVGEAVVFTATGAATFSPCAASTCTVMTNSAGVASATVTPTALGNINLTAAGRSGTAAASFTATAATYILHLVSSPAATVYLGGPAAGAFAVRITLGDGVTPAAGKPVTFSVTAGAATFGPCGTVVCTVTTDASGLASASVAASSAGSINLVATSDAGSASAVFSAVERVRSVTAAASLLFVAEGASFAWTPQVRLADNSASVSNVAVSWTSSPGLNFSQSSSASDTTGAAPGHAVVGPLAAGVSASGYACAWTNVCAQLSVFGVPAADLRLTVVNGADQDVADSGSLVPVVLRVVDPNGDPVAGASVEVDQTVSEWQAACPDTGRCPQAAVLFTASTPAISDENGIITVIPAQLPGVTPAVTRIAAITGPHGFAALSLSKHP